MNNTSKQLAVNIPATSANLGGGFDCMGLALGLYMTVTAELSDRLEITSRESAPTDGTNLIYKAMNAVFERYGKTDTPVKLRAESDIPQASGLGSSAACIVGGVLAANALLGSPMRPDEIDALCTTLDGHPDNVIPALHGGITASTVTDGEVVFVRATAPKKLACAVATPSFSLETKKARAALPDKYSRTDCVYSLSRAVVTFGALATGDLDALKIVDDRLHQPYRIPLVPGYLDMEKAFMSAGALGCCLSGAGPSVLAFFDTRPDKIIPPAGWTVRTPRLDNAGAVIINN